MKNILLHGVEVPYVIRTHKRARRIIVRMQSDKVVRVTIPPFVKKQYVETLLQQSASSILEQYQKLTSQSDVFLYLGAPLKVVTSQSEKAYATIRLQEKTLLFTTVTGESNEKRLLYKKLLQKIGKVYLTSRCLELAKQHGFTVSTVKVRHMRSRWGSCSSKNGITLNAALMQCPQEVLEYVIIHELCHTRVHNHSPRFWSEVEKYLPDFRELKSVLKQYSVW